MPGDDALDDGQADAGAFKLFHTMQALEHAEQFIRILLIEADTIIFHIERAFAACPICRLP